MVDDAYARSRAYALFSHLYRHGVTPDVLDTVRAVPDLAALVPDPFVTDDAAADHYQLFSLDVFPYASVFLDAEARLAGATAATVRRRYAHAGFAPDLDREGADHIGHALAFLAWLSGAEADALDDGEEMEAMRMATLQRDVLDGHLLWWLLPFVQAVRQQRHSFYSLLADLTLDVVLDHRMALGGTPSTEVPRLPAPQDVLGEQRAGLKDIAVFLTTPAWSGLYLSRSDIARLGRAERLPRGFGSRAQTLTNLLRSAAEFERTAALLDALHHEVRTWRQAYQDVETVDVPGVPTIAQVWQERLAGTTNLLERMREATSV